MITDICLHEYEYQYSFRVENSDPVYRYKCKHCGRKQNSIIPLNKKNKEEEHDFTDHE
jgi:hypothetical protein